MKKNNYSSIETIINIAKKGGMFILVDDEKRENEGDLVISTSDTSAKNINFMAKYGRGLICVPMSESLCSKLSLEKMVPNNTDPLETAFTVSVDLKGNGVTSGISASDRAKTVKALVSSKTKPNDLQRPGHVFPLIAKDGGVLRRTGHTEAAIDFARLSGFKSAGVIVEIMNFRSEVQDDDGLYDIYIEQLPNGSYGWNCPDGDLGKSWVEIDDDYIGTGYSTSGLDAMKISVAHEYFHAIQRSYKPIPGQNSFFYELIPNLFL